MSVTAAARPLARARVVPASLSRWLAPLSLAALVLAGYLRFLDAGFAGTDSLTLVVTNDVRSFGELLGLFTIPVMAGTTFAEHEVIYRPMASVLFALDHWLWGVNPVGFHLTNILLHLATTLGLWALARALGASQVAAWLGSAVFALHPDMVAAIPVIARRDNVVSAAPLVWSLVLLAQVASRPGPLQASWRRLAAAVALFGVGLLGKESGFASAPLVPLVALLGWRVGAERRGGRQWWTDLRAAFGLSVPFALCWLALFVVRWRVLGTLGGYADTPVGSVDTRHYQTLLLTFARFLFWGAETLLPSDSRGWIVALFALPLGLGVAALWFPRRARELTWLGVAWLGLFVVFHLVVRTLSGAWLLYYPLLGAGLLVAGAADGVRATWRAGRARASAIVAGVLAGAFTLNVLLASPLVADYPEWRLVGQTSQRYLGAAVACLADAPDGTTVTLDNPPGFLSYPGPRNDLLVPVMIADHTVESALRVAYPDKRFRIDAHDSNSMYGPPSKLQVSCSGTGAQRTVRAAY